MGQSHRGNRGPRAARRRSIRGHRPGVDRLECRALLAVTSNFAAGVLTVASDAADAIVIRRLGDNVLVNDADPDSGALPAADVTAIVVTGAPADGNAIDLSGVSAAGFPAVTSVAIDGGGGNNTILGSGLADTITAGDGDNLILGLGGDDTITAGAGNDTIVGGQGADTIDAGDGDNTIIWNQGDGSDTIDAGAGSDTVQVNGSASGDAFLVGPGAGGRLSVARTNLAPFALDIGGVEFVHVDGRLGDDTFIVDPGLDAVTGLLEVNLLGGEGDDGFEIREGATILGGSIDGGRGVDTINYVSFTSAVAVDLSGGRRFFEASLDGGQEVPPNVSPATGTGRFALDAAGTALDFEVTYRGLLGQLVGAIGAHFHAPAAVGENAGIVRGLTPAELGGRTVPDGTFSGTWTSADAEGPLTAERLEQLADGLVYFNIHTTEFPGGEIRGQVELIGTEGTGPGVTWLRNIDNVIGGQADDAITGGPLSNVIVGGPGADTISGGSGGDNVIVWNPGDGSDTIDGGAGIDTVRINGGDVAGAFEVAPGAGGRVLFGRTDPSPFSLDVGGVEALELLAGLGEDTVVIGDLTGVADLQRVDVDGGDGDDLIDASALPGGIVAATLRGGPGNDTIIGSAGDDVIFGGQGNDTITGGPGDDVIDAGVPAERALFAAVRSDNAFLFFTADAPGEVREVPAVGLDGGENIVGIDFRPSEAGDLLYVLTDQGRVYTATPDGQLTLRSTLDQSLDGAGFGVDFNPVPDRLRIVSDAGQNLRANVDGGATLVDGTLAFAAGDANEGATPGVVAAAYTNAFAGATSTALYAIDPGLDALLTQSPPNDGILNTIGGLGVDAEGDVGFDILAGSTGAAFATLSVGGLTGLYRIDLATGAASPVGTIGDGSAAILGLAAGLDNDTIIWNPGDGSDVIDGGAGQDTVVVNGGEDDEAFRVSGGPGGRVLVERTAPGPFGLDLGTVEVLRINGNGGDDSVAVAGLAGAADLQRIEVDGGEGDDTIDASGLGAAIPLIAAGGEGDDTLLGGPGDDDLDGGPGNNRIVGNGGRDVIRRGRINPADFDGDGITDYATYTPGGDSGLGLFEIRLSSTGRTTSARLGGPDAFPISGDYDGDGLTDLAVYEFDPLAVAGRFTIVQSSDGQTRTVPFGGPNDFPIAGDYDGDGKTDIAVYGYSGAEGFSRFGVLLSSTDSAYSRPFGGPNDFPIAGDYDGDGRTDIAVFGYSGAEGFSRFGILPSGLNDLTYSEALGGYPVAFGGLDDGPVSGDYDGDGKTDIAVYGFSGAEGVYRFAVIPSGTGSGQAIPFGGEGDLPVGADSTGDGTTELAVFGPGPDDAGPPARFLVRAFAGGEELTVPFGARTSIPLPPPSGLFEIQPLPEDAVGASSAPRRAGASLFDLALEGILAEDDGLDLDLG